MSRVHSSIGEPLWAYPPKGGSTTNVRYRVLYFLWSWYLTTAVESTIGYPSYPRYRNPRIPDVASTVLFALAQLICTNLLIRILRMHVLISGSIIILETMCSTRTYQLHMYQYPGKNSRRGHYSFGDAMQSVALVAAPVVGIIIASHGTDTFTTTPCARNAAQQSATSQTVRSPCKEQLTGQWHTAVEAQSWQDVGMLRRDSRSTGRPATGPAIIAANKAIMLPLPLPERESGCAAPFATSSCITRSKSKTLRPRYDSPNSKLCPWYLLQHQAHHE